MTVITSNEQLMLLIPNAITTVKGETPLYDKITPYLLLAERWLCDDVLSDIVLSELSTSPTSDEWNIIQQIIVCDAFRRAIPSLDLVLTPNGFGIVSNTNIAPASKERVERLITSLLDLRDRCLEILMPLLPKQTTWLDTHQASRFRQTLFPTPTLCTLLSVKENRWDTYLSLQQQLLLIEQTLEASYFSKEQMDIFRKEEQCQHYDYAHRNVIKSIQSIELSMLRAQQEGRDTHPLTSRIIDIVDTLRKNESFFPEWHVSPLKELFTPPVFENKLHSPGYWF